MSGSDSEDGDIPSASECDRRCHEFAQVTGTDVACGHFFLQENKWILEAAVAAFFDAAEAQPSVPKRPRLVDIVEINDEESTSSAAAKSSGRTSDEQLVEFSILSWNIDGLDTGNLNSRTKTIIDEIKRSAFDIIFLQEVVPQTLSLLESNFCGQPATYQLIPGGVSESCGYFTVMMLRLQTVKVTGSKVTSFVGSIMGRTLLETEAVIGGLSLRLLTSHLESCKEHSEERVNQLRQCFQRINAIDSTHSVIFGGDLNLRDSELAQMGSDRQENTEDLWMACGSPKECQFTWDCLKNDNLAMPKFKPRARYDRLFWRPAASTCDFKPTGFGFVGQQRIRSCLRFPSDHFGIVCKFVRAAT